MAPRLRHLLATATTSTMLTERDCHALIEMDIRFALPAQRIRIEIVAPYPTPEGGGIRDSFGLPRRPRARCRRGVLLLERLSPALEQVDSSSGALGSAVDRAIETLVPLIAAADVESAVRERWLERLFEALQDDQVPYIESLGEHWGSLCVAPELASQWADRLLPLVMHVL